MAILRCDIRSTVLEQDTSLTVVLPYDRPAKNQAKPCRVLYLLHGIKLNDTGWLRRTNVEAYAEHYGLALIMPDGARSFYTDGEHTPPYGTYLSEELPRLCGELFGISSRREDTFVAGLSMGGYGALKLALSNPHRFCAGAGFSAVCDPIAFARTMGGSHTQKEAAAIWGSEYRLQPRDDLFHLAGEAAKLPEAQRPRLYLCCGTEDPLYEQNLHLKAHLESLPLQTTFEAWPGGHDWVFWDAAVRRALSWMMDSTQP